MRRWMVGAVLVMVGGCEVGTSDPNDGGQFGEESGARCEAVRSTPLAMDEVSALGFSPQDLVQLALGGDTLPLTWADGSSTTLTEVVEQAGDPAYVEYEVVTTGTGGIEPALWCENQVEFDVTIGFATDDGRFAESFSTRLKAGTADRASATVQLGAVSGTFDAWDFAPANNDYDDLRAWIDFAWDASGPSGTIDGQGSGEDGDVAFAEAVDIASWGAAQE